MTRFAIFLIFALFAQATSAEEAVLESKAKLLSAASTVFAGMCAEYRGHVDQATSEMGRRLAKEGEQLWCACAPAEMERLSTGLADPAPKKAVFALYNQATAICTGQQMRKSIAAVCPTDQDLKARVQDMATYCTCVESRLAAKTDEELSAELGAAYNNELRDTKASGKPLMFLETFGLRKYGAGCEAARKL